MYSNTQNIKVNKFDSIRPYLDNEVNKVLIDLSNNRRFLKMLFETGEYKHIKYLPFSRKILGYLIRNKIKNINSVADYQNMFESIVSDVVNKSIDNFSVTGIENLNQTKGYLFISNHRDITLDSALLNLSLHKNNLNTTNNAVGNNLLSEKWASDLMRLNKSFIIDRSDKSKREIYKSLNLSSEFINETILKNNNSIWIAQKQGRSKDGNDYTDPSVIKMIHLHARKKIPVHEYLNSLNIIPISISYEKDPNDITKTNELYLTNLNKKYTKEPKEDLKSIAEGIRGQKGDVHLHIGSVMEFTTDSYEDCSDQITTEIKRSYKLHATNYAAALMQGKKVTIDSFNENQIDDAIQYLNRRMLLISEEMQPYFLNQYSNPTNV
jgi:1-acyl-sn-glycerol-3-phosphate acyltransferase